MKKLLILALVLMLALSLVACNGNSNSGNGGDEIGGSLDGGNGSGSGTDSGSNPGTSDGETGDGSVPHTHTLTKTESAEATCTANGNIEYYTCSGCSKLFADANAANEITILDTVIPAEHKLTFTAEVEATCKAEGNVAYYHCSVCEKNFENENGTGEIDNVVLEKNDNHTGGTEIRDTKEPTEEEEGYTGDTYCLGCGKKIKDGTSINALNHVHAMSKVEAIEKTCTENGNIEYYTCSKCGKYYTDENGTNEITLEDTIIKASHKLTYAEANDATCKEDGNVAYYTCSSCSEKFSDADATNKITDVVIPKNDNHVGGTEIRDVKEATEEEEGYTGDTYCLGCGEKIADGESVDKLPHTHSMTKTEKTEATCTTDGNIEYYTCSKCGKYYTDENGTQEITLADTILNSNGHNYENNKCTVCDEKCPSEGLEFTLNSDKASYSVTGIGSCTDTDIIIPATYNNLHVTSIGYEAFSSYTSITSITIPNSVTSIGSFAFDNCSSLTSITIGNRVTSIGRNAFRSCESLTSITIPDSVTSIGEYAFYYCYRLASIRIPDSVTSIGEYAFKYCYSLTSVTIPNSVTSIGSDAFYGCSSLTSVTIPDSVTSIGSYSFYNCSSLTSITIGNRVASIGKRAFMYCESLTSVTIPDSVNSIGYGAFSDCKSLTSVVIPDSVTSIGEYAFSRCSNLKEVHISDIEAWCNISFGDDDANPLYNGASLYLNGSIISGDIVIPEGVKTIPTSTFRNSTVTSIKIPDSVTYIGSSAFSGCTSLTSITIPDSVTFIGGSAFSGCTSLTSITIPNSVTSSIGSYAFYNCTSLTSIAIPDSVTSIGEYAFKYCYSLTSVTIPNSVTSIGEWAFCDCRGLTSVTIGNSVTSIGRDAFYNCTSLTSVTIGNSVTSIGRDAFYGCYKLVEVYNLSDLTITKASWNKNGHVGYYALNVYTDTEGQKKTFETEDGYLFYEDGDTCYLLGYKGDKTDITLPENCRGKNYEIYKYAFYNNDNITKVIIPNSVISIGEDAFMYCYSLTSVTIPNSVNSIGSGAFYGCYKLIEVYNLSDLTITAGSALNVYNSLDIPSKQWKTEDGFLFYEDGDTCYLLGYTGDKTEITLPESCNGKNYEIYKYAFYKNYKLTKVTIPNSVTSIGNSAFSGCDSLTSVTIGNNVTSIGSEAFYDCDSLTSVTIGNSVTSIGVEAFEDCTKLKEVHVSDIGAWCNISFSDYHANPLSNGANLYLNEELVTDLVIPDSVKEIKDYAFYGCSSLTSITIPDSVTSIGSFAFDNCSSLTSITIGNSVTSIGEYAFYGCSGLTSIAIPDSVTSIGDRAFYNCSSLTSVTIPDSVTSIGRYAFYGCSSLKEVHINDIEAWCNISFAYESSNPLSNGANLYLNGKLVTELVIPDSVKEIKDYAFSSCTSLTNVTIGNSVTTIGECAFEDCTSLTSVTIGNNVTHINYYAFSGCRGLTSVTIPNNVTSIGSDAFYGCSSLTSITIPFVGASKDATGYKSHFGYIFGYSSSSSSSSNYHYYDLNEKTYFTYDIPQSLKTVIMGNSVTSIGSYVFSGCRSLTSVTIGNSVTAIGQEAFNGCSNLKEVHISDIGAWCNISFGNEYANPLSNGANLYLDDNYVTDLVIPETVKKIKDDAFYNFTGLTSVTIPDSVTSIGYDAFNGCSNLKEVYISDIGAWCNISFGGSYANPLCYAKNLYLNGELITELVIPNGVTSIPMYAFYRQSSITNLTIPDSVTSIGEYAFKDCYKLAEVYNLSDLTITAGSSANGYVGYYALNVYTDTEGQKKTFETEDEFLFYEDGDTCYLLGYTGDKTEITLPESCNAKNYEIYKYAFYNNDNITKVTIPNSVTSIGGYAFYNCTAFTEIYFNATAMNNLSSNNYVFSYAGAKGVGIKVVIGKNVTKIPAYLFYNSNHIISVEFEKDSACESIGNSAFYDCLGLKEVHINDIEAWCNISFGNEYANPLYYAKNLYLNGNLVTKLVIPDTIREIKAFAFYRFTSLTGVIIPDSVTSIGNYAFYDCTSLTSVTIGNNVTSIGRYAFSSCISLTSVTIGDSVTSISDYAFNSCYKLVEVYNLSDLTITAGSNDNGYVGYYAIGVYNSLDIPSKQWKTEDGFLFYEDGDTCYLLGYKGDKTEITLPESCNGKNYEIYKYAFYKNDKLTKVTIPDSVTSIDYEAFRYCTNLTSITIPDSVTFIGAAAFSDCTSLTCVTIGNSVTSIGSFAFDHCTSLTSVTIPDSVTSIGWSAFSDCTSLTSVTIGNSVTSIGQSAFRNCTSLTSVTIPNSVTSIGQYAFYGCSNLTSVVFENPNGWWYASSSSATSGTSISGLSSASTAAKYLRDTYSRYYWKRS